jgi:SAM-dependent methyltransferase
MTLKLRPFRGRLAQFKTWSNCNEDWDRHWESQLSKLREHLRHDPGLGEYEIFTRYLPKNLPVLEAGCGLGTIVAALAARGYQVEGVDYADETIRRVRDAAPHLDVRVGDIYHLDVADHTYGGYISLGVLEHNPDGPLDGLREARRVLHAQGVALFTIPFLNAKRTRILKRRLQHPSRSELTKGVDFYQFYFSPQEFSHHLETAGFGVVELFPFSVEWGLCYDYPWVAWLSQRRFFHWRCNRVFLRCCRNAPHMIRKRYAHMMMYVCKPR